MQAQTANAQKSFSIGAVMTRCREAAARCLAAEGQAPERMQVSLLSQRRDSLVLKIAAGDLALAVKAFDPDNPDAPTLLEREVQVTNALRGKGLAPRLLGHSERGLFLITEHVPGAPLDTLLTDENMTFIARRLGSWFRVFSDSLPRSTGDTDWAAYLEQYAELLWPEDLLLPEELERHRGLLSGQKIRTRTLAKNDAALSNFRRSPEARLIGLDFDTVTLKPTGWDLLVTARSLAQRFPDRVGEAAQALVEGWRGPVDGNDPEGFAELVQLFAEATADRRPTRTGGRLTQYRDRYNALAAEDPALPQVARVYGVPMLNDDLEPVRPDQIEALRAALTAEAKAALAAPPETAPARPASLRPPSPVLAGACAVCKGRCCREGETRFAYVKAATMQRVMQDKPGITAPDLVQYYLDQLPQDHVRGSCLYHGSAGCTLAREARANICNSYLCRTGRTIEGSDDALRNSPDPVLFVAADRGRAQRVGVQWGGQLSYLDPADLAPPPPRA